jgi:ribonucleoside-diphosphate reductase alpha subunit
MQEQMSITEMKVVKRDGKHEDISFDKILNRVKTIGKESNVSINFSALVMKVIDQLYNNIHTKQIDELTAEQCASIGTQHPDYGILASRIVVSNHQKNTLASFSKTMELLYNFTDIHNVHSPLISKQLYEISQTYGDELEAMIDYKRDYLIEFFGFKTLERAYLMKVNKKIVERPQHMWMRVAVGIHGDNLEKVKQTYEHMSQKFFTHATPTLFNAGTPRPQLSSCYLLSMENDSIDGIYDTLKDCAKISKWAGGIGLHVHNIRGTGSHIRGTNGTSNGIVPMLRVFNMTARYVDQGGGRRNGSFAIYLEPWHTDVVEFLDLRKNHGDEELRTRDLFLALWMPDLFMERVKTDGMWSLMCPDQCPGLSDCYGENFKQLYERYEAEGKYTKTMKARNLWFKILDAQMETGVPYLLFKDACNDKSNQKNLGVIKSSNLCTEIIEYSSPTETAVCNLASIGVNRFVRPIGGTYQKAIIYTKNNCNFCVKAKNLLKLHNIFYEETNLDNDDERKAFYKTMKETTGHEINSVPQIYLDDKYIGGYDNLCNTLKTELNYEKLHEVTKIVTENLNQIIDINYYPTDKTLRSNSYHRPIGIGIQGLADAFFMLDVPFHSNEAIEINKKIFETMYHAALEKSMELSIERRKQLLPLLNYLKSTEARSGDDIINIDSLGKLYNSEITLSNNEANVIYHKYKPIAHELFGRTPDYYKPLRSENLLGAYSSFEGSPASNGILQFDMWNATPSDRYDWNGLKQQIIENGIRNSLLLAPMPTASTSQILGNNECFEPLTSNIYSRRTLAGEFVMVNKYLMNDLMNIGKWNDAVKNNIIANNGSVQQLDFLSQHLKDKYKIVWEIPMKHLIDMARDRGAYICQSQSLNLWIEDPDYKTLTSMHFYSHAAGLKTAIYYMRRKPKHHAQQFTIEPEKNNSHSTNETTSTIQIEEEGSCEMCSG